MRKVNLLAGIAIASATIALASCGAKYKTVDQIKSKGVIVMATNAAFPPFESTNGDKFVGIDVDIMEAYAKSLGVELKIENQEFDAAILAPQTNKADVAVAGITVNEKRKQVLDFTEGYYTSSQVVIVNTDSLTDWANLNSVETIRTLLTAKKAKIGSQRGTVGEYYAAGNDDWEFEKIADTTSTSFDNGAQAIQSLANGKLDAVIIDKAPAEMITKSIKEKNPNAPIQVIDVVLTEEEYAIAVTKGNDTLVADLNKFISQIKSDGTLNSIIAKHYGQND